MIRTCACQNSNPLVRDGTSQATRGLPALDPARAPVDGRDVAAYLEYLREYARQLRYFDLNNQPAGNWAPFLESDVSSVAAAVAAQDAERERRRLLILAGGLIRAGGREALRRLLDALMGLARRLDGWGQLDAKGLRFPQVLLEQVYGGLRADLQLLIGIHKAAAELGLLVASPADSSLTVEQVLAEGLGPAWWAPGAASWTAFVAAVPSRVEAFGARARDMGAPESEKLARAQEYLRPLVESFTRTLARMVEVASDDLGRTLADWPRHEPPMALLLAFLHLFRHALDELDGLTGRHLQYYYREVLRLKPREAEPDHVFLTFELARHLESHVLPAGTVLLGGKDAQGLPLRYALDEDLRVDRTAAGPFYTVHRTEQGLLTASAAADSAGGLGAPLTPEQPAWPALGSPTHPAASIGFALASPVLLLAEGERGLTLELDLQAPPEALRPLRALDLGRLFRIEVTTPKGWLSLEAREARMVGNSLVLGLRLAPEDPPLTPYQRALHGGALDTVWPVCRFVLAQSEASGRTYGALAGLALTRARVDVAVSGVRTLTVETDVGRMAPAKPFAPFGPQPLPGSAFSVQCAELRSKALTSLTLGLDWQEPAADLDLDAHYQGYALQSAPSRESFKEQRLAQAREQARKDEDEELSASLALRRPTEDPREVGLPPRDLFQVELTVGVGPAPAPQPGNTSRGALFSAATFQVRPSLLSSGNTPRAIDTLRVRLTGPKNGFGHRLYSRLHTDAVIALSRTQPAGTPPAGTPTALPNPPLTPRLAGLTLSYSARAELRADTPASAEDCFFHLHPFGETREAVGDTTPWLPSYPNEGELYVGLERPQVQQRVSLLFQVQDGSANPLLDAADLSWTYLATDGRFHLLRGEALGDGTGGLVRSGLVRVVLPSNATDAGGRLPAGRFWLRASVPARTAATCNLIAVRAQGASATLLDAATHPVHLASSLPAGTVTKLERRLAAFKKVEQPVASFGGRAPEAPLPFARRVSERLRHKHRPITLHDYETLVLEAFPSLYKVKCLNHTRLESTRDLETAPGSVTVVTIPNLVGRQSHNPFTPYTSQDTLSAVARFLQPLVGPFVRLQVKNPTYEPVRLSFRVRFVRGKDPALGLSALKQELNAFLSPWAFEAGRDIIFGGTLHRATLLHFVERRPYVDFVTDFQVQHLVGDVASDAETVVARTLRSILVSAGEHAITLDEERP